MRAGIMKHNGIVPFAVWPVAAAVAFSASRPVHAADSEAARLAALEREMASLKQLLLQQVQRNDALAAEVERLRSADQSSPEPSREVPSSATSGAPSDSPLSRQPVEPPAARPASVPPSGGLVKTSRPDFRLTLGGSVRAVAMYSEKRPVGSAGAVFMLAPPDVTGTESIFDYTAQYSTLRAGIEGPEFHGMKTGATMLFQFYNGQLLDDQYGFTPGLAYTWLDDGHWNLSFGRRFDLFSERQPEMVDGFGILGASGNPGNSLRTQLRAEYRSEFGGDHAFSLGAALSEPISTSISDDFKDRAEDNGMPNLEAKAQLRLGQPDGDTLLARPALEAGVSGVYGEFRKFTGTAPPWPPPDIIRPWGAALEAGARLGSRFGIHGELYAGEALGNYLGTALQTVNPANRKAIASHGGWLEATLVFTPSLRMNAGYGIDQPDRADLFAGQVARNQTAYLNLFSSITPELTVGLEQTWRRTEYLGLQGSDRANEGWSTMLSLQYGF